MTWNMLGDEVSRLTKSQLGRMGLGHRAALCILEGTGEERARERLLK